MFLNKLNSIFPFFPSSEILASKNMLASLPILKFWNKILLFSKITLPSNMFLKFKDPLIFLIISRPLRSSEKYFFFNYKEYFFYIYFRWINVQIKKKNEV